MVNIGDVIFQIVMLLILIGGVGAISAFIIGVKRLIQKQGANEKRLQRMEQKLDNMLKNKES
jgi:anionic cell wall polymer biosynthesis LytR-Cps2A-Psr (LCP) family protein